MDDRGHDAASATEEQESENEMIWFQSTVSVKGLTETSSQPVDVGGFM